MVFNMSEPKGEDNDERLDNLRPLDENQDWFGKCDSRSIKTERTSGFNKRLPHGTTVNIDYKNLVGMWTLRALVTERQEERVQDGYSERKFRRRRSYMVRGRCRGQG